jgi:hypothetical protein
MANCILFSLGSGWGEGALETIVPLLTHEIADPNNCLQYHKYA